MHTHTHTHTIYVCTIYMNIYTYSGKFLGESPLKICVWNYILLNFYLKIEMNQRDIFMWFWLNAFIIVKYWRLFKKFVDTKFMQFERWKFRVRFNIKYYLFNAELFFYFNSDSFFSGLLNKIFHCVKGIWWLIHNK